MVSKLIRIGVVITKNNKNLTTGIVTDGDKRLIQNTAILKRLNLRKL